MTALPGRQLGRTDRYVRNGRLSLSAGAPRHKLAFLTEESLRLCSLPGEDEGRVYYFRRLCVKDLPEDGDRRAWLNAFQSAMREQAALAIHGVRPDAAMSRAVYFRSQEEACETLLMRITASVATTAPAVWFWRHISSTAANASAPEHVVGVIKRLLSTPPGWSAVAAAVLSVARERDVVALLELLPARALEEWLRELGSSRAAYSTPVHFPKSVRPVVLRALTVFGHHAREVLWLASLAVISVEPSTAENQSAVAIARASLQMLLAEAAVSTATQPKPASSHLSTLRPTGDPPPREPTVPPALADPPRAERTSEKAVASPTHRHPQLTAPPLAEFCFGERTEGAGLYFLLNVLRHLDTGTQPFRLLFLARLFQRIATHAGIEAGDPILRWAEVTEAQNEPQEIDERLLRIWMLHIRRWCWRNGRISAREIVRRPGYVTLTRTDLDVTLSIDSADIRIRRIGLDLDPGWLPWFGRVVRFHYRYRGEYLG